MEKQAGARCETASGFQSCFSGEPEKMFKIKQFHQLIFKYKKYFMNKKDSNEIVGKNKTIRFTKNEAELVKQKSNNAGMSFSAYCREMAVNGYVQAVRNAYDMNEIRTFKNLLLEYKTNFSRISNLIKERNPLLNEEITKLKNSIQKIIDNINL